MRKIEHRFQSATLDALRILRRCTGCLEAVIWGWIVFLVIERVARHGSGEAHCKIELPSGRPSAGLAHAGHRVIVVDGYSGPQHLAGIVIDAAAQVEQDVTLRAFSKCISVN